MTQASTSASVRRLRMIAMVLLLVAGVIPWLTSGQLQQQPYLRAAILAPALLLAVLAALLPARIHQPLARRLEALRSPSTRVMAITALAWTILAALYFYHVAFSGGRDYVPQWHDEHMMALQVQQMARGRLWMPEHELADFFEALFVQVRGAYGSIYFPGAALWYVPGAWLGLPGWAMPLLTTAAVVGMSYLVITRLIDGLAGMLAAFLMMSLDNLRTFSAMLVSHPVMALLGLLMLFGWLAWRRNLAVGWAIFIGAAAGWAAITRPLDAVCFALPISVAMLLRMRQEPAKRWALAIAPAVAAALPFLGVQVVQNLGMTGSPLTTPYVQYAQRYQPNSGLGFHDFNPALRAQGTLPQKHDYYDNYIVHYLKVHRPAILARDLFTVRMPLVFRATLPHLLLLAFVLAGLLCVTGIRWVPLAALLLFIGLYALNPVFLLHYGVVFAPIVVMLALLGCAAIADVFPRWKSYLTVAGAAAVVALGLSGFPELNPAARPSGGMETVTSAHHALRGLPHTPAVVLFPYQRGMNFHDEPVYNITSAWPDDAEVIRAHDRGADNLRIVRYYARRQPNRHFYRFDRAENTVHYLGSAQELLREMEQGE